MKIYNQTKTEILEDVNLEKGYLIADTLIIHHEAVERVEEVSHYITLSEYQNGGKDVKKIIDIFGVEAKDAYDEMQEIQVYIPYSEGELTRMNVEREISEFKQYLSSTDYCVIKCMETGESMATLYPEVHAKRTAARQRINELEALIAAESTSEES